MAKKFVAGQQVRIKQDAFKGSDVVSDYKTRGQIGTVTNTPDRQSCGYYEVELESGLYLLKPSELEAA